MPRGNGPGLAPDMRAWLEPYKKDYLALTKIGRAVENKPNPTDDPKLKEWLMDLWNKFEKHFKVDDDDSAATRE
ncbi:hypothetical protein H0H93_014966, partial [Arthromyces matolae]